ncbi:MAG: lytic transglycosylase domain-containing protein [Paracoccaceae bacterium]|nr:lytic transglycosylase domain-containing protein [Paracoccaceae bacterium]
MWKYAAAFLLCLSAPVCASPDPATPDTAQAAPSGQAVTASLRPNARSLVVPEARWGTGGGRIAWSMAVLSALRGHAQALPKMTPKDIASWCPAYPNAGTQQREAFWVGLVSSLVKHESTFRPTAVGGGGKWYGLTQILPATARGYGCRARTGAALKHPGDNLSCAMRIMAVTVPRDGVVSRGMRGVAADWGPFHSTRKREDMKNWVRKQAYCNGLSRSLRPVARRAPNPVVPPSLATNTALQTSN